MIPFLFEEIKFLQNELSQNKEALLEVKKEKSEIFTKMQDLLLQMDNNEKQNSELASPIS